MNVKQYIQTHVLLSKIIPVIYMSWADNKQDLCDLLDALVNGHKSAAEMLASYDGYITNKVTDASTIVTSIIESKLHITISHMVQADEEIGNMHFKVYVDDNDRICYSV